MPGIEQWLRSANLVEATWVALGAYALGCIATGYYLVRYRTGQDLRELGSGSLGARNVGRVLGWRGFVVTALGDVGKGAFAVWATTTYKADPMLAGVALISVVAGHIWPAQLRFQGGKGVVTSLGALLVYDFRLVLAYALLFAGAYAFFRKTVLPALFAFTCLPVAAFWLPTGAASLAEPAKAVIVSCLAGLVLFAHRKNLVEETHRLIERRHLAPKSNHNQL